MRRWIPVMVIAGALLLTTVFANSHEVNRPSITSAAGGGYRAAHAYIQAQGRDAAGWDRPLADLADPGTLIVALPGLRPIADEDIAPLARWIRRGGHLVYLPSGMETIPSTPAMLGFLRVAEVADADAPPTAWPEWSAWTADRLRLVGPAGALALSARSRTTLCPVGSSGLYQTTDGHDAVCTLKVGTGSVTVVNNATVWTNNQLASGANLALLATLTDHPGPVWFDEWHQGAHPTAVESDLGLAQPALLAHAGLLYCAFAWALSRPVGPPLRPLAGPTSSMLRELGVLGQLHAAGGHAPAAADRLRTLARARFRRKKIETAIPPTRVTDEASLVTLARQIGTLEQEG